MSPLRIGTLLTKTPIPKHKASLRHDSYGQQSPSATNYHDDTGLLYYKARYYDKLLGAFISPDPLIPDPSNVFAYNRYLYGLANPLKYNDPSGHCATTSKGSRDRNDADCWRLTDTIASMWDDTDYWQSRFGDVDVWNEHMAPSDLDAEFFANELDMFLNSDAGRDWLNDVPMGTMTEQDLGDYSALNVSYFIVEASLVIDDFGNIFARIGPSAGTPGVAITRGDVFLRDRLDGERTDIDGLGLTPNQKMLLMQTVMVGDSISVDANFRLFATGYSRSDTTITVEGGVGGYNFGGAISPVSRTWYVGTLAR